MMQFFKHKKILLVGCLSLLSTAFVIGQDTPTVEADSLSISNNKLLTQLEAEMNLGFISEKKGMVVGSASSVKPSDFMKIDNSQWVRDALNGRVVGLRGSDNIHGLGEALIVVDGIPGRNIDLLNMEEIEEITVLKDATAVALYGSMARNGVIVVKTKRGSDKKEFNVSASTGIKVPVRMPQYLNSADYMTLYNEARVNDGMTPAYTSEEIDKYRSGINPYRYPDVDLYGDDYFNPFAQFTNVTADFSGAVNNTRYYINVGFNSDGSLQDLNADYDKGAKRFNVRGNIDFKINDWIKSSLDVMSVIQSDKSSLTNLYDAGSSFRPNLYAPLLPVSLVDTTGNAGLAGIVDAANKFGGYILGGQQVFRDNTPVASVLAGGYQKQMARISQMNNSIDFDLSAITEGLSAKSYVSFDFYNAYNLKIQNSYAVYEPTWNYDGKIVDLNNVKDPDRKDQTERVTTNDFIIRYGFYGLVNYKKQLNDNNAIDATLLGFVNNTLVNGDKQLHKNSHVALNVNYNLKDKFLVDLSAVYMNSIKLAEGNRGVLSPALGLAYIFNKGSFVDDINWLDYLKIRGSAGLLHSDLGIDEYFLYDEFYTRESYGYSWNDSYSNNYTSFSRGRNYQLKSESRTDFNLGFEASLFGRVGIEANAFQSEIGDQVSRTSTLYPGYYDALRPYVNNNVDRYSGIELGVDYFADLGKLTADIGLRAMYNTTKRIKVDEKYEDDYRYHQGKPIDAIWGLEDMGFFQQDDFDVNGDLKDGIPTQYGTVKPGDIRYKDMNNDQVIDDRDMVNIGRWSAPWTFGSDINLNYGRFSLFVLLTADIGGDAVLSGDYYRPQAEDKYSEVVLGRWTPETAEVASFPRLSTQESTNNFGKTSTFWMYSTSNFKINRLQLTYELPTRVNDKLKMDDISVYASGSNLIEFSENRKVKELQTSGEPFYRYYTLGLRLKF